MQSLPLTFGNREAMLEILLNFLKITLIDYFFKLCVML